MAKKDTTVLFSAKGRIIVDTDRKDEFVKAGYFEKEVSPVEVEETPVEDVIAVEEPVAEKKPKAKKG